MYNQALRELSTAEPNVVFDNNGEMSGVTHAVETSVINFATTGLYEVTFSVSATEPSQFSLYLDNALVPGSTYGSGAGTQQNNGQAIVSVTAGQGLQLRMVGVATATLATNIGGSQTNENASVFVLRIS